VVELSPLEFLDRLADLVPPPRPEDRANPFTKTPSPGTDLRIFEDSCRVDETLSRLKCNEHWFPSAC
jgi:hypothetical protein